MKKKLKWHTIDYSKKLEDQTRFYNIQVKPTSNFAKYLEKIISC